MKFVDEAVIEVRAGKGGDGLAHFARTRRNPQGGPDGGDGGDGGNVVLVGDSRLWTLLDFKHRSIIVAEDGRAGGPNCKKGRSGKSVKVKVPLGCKVFDAKSKELLGDIVKNGQSLIVAKGGRGGLGNFNFASARNRVPTKFTRGKEGEKRFVLLSLEVLAHVGLIGLPNSGKSTLLRTISSSKPKIGDYPFTTLHPNLGVVTLGDNKIVVADLPGLIPGASKGRGLGVRFLKHASRCMLLCHLIESTKAWVKGKPNLTEFLEIEEEIRKFSEDVFGKPRLVVVSKMDLADASFCRSAVSLAFLEAGYSKIVFVSSLTGEGIQDLLFQFEESIRLPVLKSEMSL